MKIFSQNPEQISTAKRAVGNRQANEAANAINSLSKGSAASTDTVNLSKEGKSLAAEIRKLASVPSNETSLARLAELREAIESGHFKVNSTAIAEAILKDES